MLDKHPKPVYVDALQLICAIRARLEQAWLGLVGLMAARVPNPSCRQRGPGSLLLEMPGPLPSIAKPPGTIATVSRRFTGGAFSVGVARGALAFPARTGRSTGSMRRRSKILARHDADMAAARAAWRKRLPYASDLASGHRRAQKPPTAFNSEITQNINAPRARLAGREFTRTIDGTPVGSERAFPFGQPRSYSRNGIN